MKFTFDNNIPIYIQILEYMKIYLISGVFKCGEKLPSVREFATTFKVNPNTMQKALAELESMKLEVKPVSVDFAEGDTVKITDGPLSGYLGKVIELKADKSKVLFCF